MEHDVKKMVEFQGNYGISAAEARVRDAGGAHEHAIRGRGREGYCDSQPFPAQDAVRAAGCVAGADASLP